MNLKNESITFLIKSQCRMRKIYFVDKICFSIKYIDFSNSDYKSYSIRKVKDLNIVLLIWFIHFVNLTLKNKDLFYLINMMPLFEGHHAD